MAVPFMSLYVTQSLKRSPSDAGLIITLFGAGSVLGSALGGTLTDKIGFRPVQIISLLFSGSFFLLFSTIAHFSTLCILSVVISFFSDAFRPANFTAVAAYARPGTETRSYSLNRLATNVGWALGTSLGGIIASFNYQLLFIVDGGISILAAIGIWSLLPQARAAAKQVKAGLEAAGEALKKPWQDKVFVYFILITTVFATCFFLMFRIGPLYFKEVWGMDELVIGLLMGLNGVLVALFEMVAVSYLEKRRTPGFYIVTGVVVLGIAYLLMLLPASVAVPALTISIILFTTGEMLTVPFINTFVVSRSNHANRGQYAAGYTLSWSFARVAGPAGGFYLAEHFGYRLLWISLCGLLLLCALVYRLMLRRHKPFQQ